MGKSIKFSLVFRDMWQSAGKYQPRVEQLLKVAPAIIRMGCFDRVETNGGGFEQVNLLFGENPNTAVRQWTAPFRAAGIETHMLDRALNGLRMKPCAKDLRQLFYKVKKAQGTDITRIFCGLNDARNVIPSIEYAKAAGMVAQAALCITHSPLHSVDYYIQLATTFIEAGADEICLKDMAGVGRPDTIGRICQGIKSQYPSVPLTYHSHAGPGFCVASILEACKNGCDFIDTGMSPLAWGTGHADIITVQEMLKDAGFEVKPINMEAYMEARSIIQEMYNDFLGYYIPQQNHINNALLIKSGLPGGMMGSLMTDLEDNLADLNKWKKKNNQAELNTDQLLIKLFDEVAYVWPKLGYPPLVTPYSQYVKNLALMNVISLEKGKSRWSMISDPIWDMILGKAGKLPGEIDDEIKALAIAQKREFFTATPQENYPDCLDDYRAKMQEKSWNLGQDEEELFEYAMHPEQYEAYKSGKAKADFEADLAQRKAKKNAVQTTQLPHDLTISLNGESYRLTIDYDNENHNTAKAVSPNNASHHGEGEDLLSPLSGKFYFTKDSQETAKQVGDEVKAGEVLCYVEAMKTQNAICAEFDGLITAFCFSNGDSVDEDDVLVKVVRK